MSADIQLGEIDRGARGKLVATLHRDPDYLGFRHIERSGVEGGRLVLKLEEIEPLTSLLAKASAIASAPGGAMHRRIKAFEVELELDRKLF